MIRVPRWLIGSLACASILAACYNGPGVDSPYGTGTSWPEGIVTPPQGAVTGIYSGSSGDPFCCWMGPDAAFRMRIPAAARTVHLSVLMPPTLRVYATHPESLTVHITGEGSRSFDDLGSGDHALVIPLHRHGNMTVDVSLHASFTFAPSKFGINGDSRNISVVLLRVSSRKR